MLKILEDLDSNVLITVGIVELTEHDWKDLTSSLKSKIQQFGIICWYFEMEDFRSNSIKTEWEDNLFIQTYKDRFERIAVVGTKDWHGWMCELMKPFTRAEVQFFEIEDQNKAHTWIRDTD